MVKSLDSTRSPLRKYRSRLLRNECLPIKTPGRARIELLYIPSGQVQVTVISWCDKPIMVETAMSMLDSIQNKSNVVVNPFDPKELMRKRHAGGPPPPSDSEKLRIVLGWRRVQGHMNQEVYTREHGISPATLRRWIHQLEKQGSYERS